MKNEFNDEMKICFIGSAKSIHMQRWSKWFADRGHEIHLITSSPGEIEGVRVHLIGNGKENSPFNFIRKIIQTKKLVRKIKPDILHAHYAFGPGTFGAFSGFHPFIISTLGSDILIDSKSRVKRWFLKYAIKKVDSIAVINKSMKDRLIKLGCNRRKMVPLRISTVDTDKFQPSKRTESIRESVGAKDGFLVLSARWFKPIYHVDVFIRAIPYILEKLSNVKFIIIGSGHLENKLKDLSKELKIEKNISFVGKICHEDMPKYLASVDLYVDTFVSVSSMWDESSIDETSGVGTTTVEAMSCGVPILLAFKNEMRKYPYKTYYPLDSQDLANKIVDLLKNEELRKQLKKQAREFAIRTVDMTVHMKKWEKLYEKLISPGII